MTPAAPQDATSHGTSPHAASPLGTSSHTGSPHGTSSCRAYLDWAATAPFDERLADAIESASWANANSLHAEGRAARAQLDEARAAIAEAIGAHAPTEVFFTSGGTESDNTALLGLSKPVSKAARTHVVMSAIEHEAVLETAGTLKSRGFAVDKISPDKRGVVAPTDLDDLLRRIDDAGDATTLVCVQALNNELGTIQPVRELAAVAHDHGALFATDAVQALGKIDIVVERDGIDAASFSAHKIGALKGTGALFVRRGLRAAPLLHGGGQESGLRSGTSNVMGARAFAAAASLATSGREELWERASAWREEVLGACAAGGFAHRIAPAVCAGDRQAPHIIALIADGLEGETMVQRADDCGIALSSGSACGSGSRETSHVLRAVGIPPDRAAGELRVSMGSSTTQDDIDALLEALPQILR